MKFGSSEVAYSKYSFEFMKTFWRRYYEEKYFVLKKKFLYELIYEWNKAIKLQNITVLFTKYIFNGTFKFLTIKPPNILQCTKKLGK